MLVKNCNFLTAADTEGDAYYCFAAADWEGDAIYSHNIRECEICSSSNAHMMISNITV